MQRLGIRFSGGEWHNMFQLRIVASILALHLFFVLGIGVALRRAIHASGVFFSGSRSVAPHARLDTVADSAVPAW
jgi:hypothetical protein